MWVKICANTTLEDALQAAEAGADAVGFVFAPSKRQVTPEQVREITCRLPAGVERIGVFASESVETIALAAKTAGLTSVQLHGGVDLEHAERLRPLLPAGVTILHTAHWRVAHDPASAAMICQAVRAVAEAGRGERLLIDAKVGDLSGGLGVSFDWGVAGKALADRSSIRIIVAGGLRPDNVRMAIDALQPYGVDVASGVEREPGTKNYRKVSDFIANVRAS